jgi:hypothetical protein
MSKPSDDFSPELDELGDRLRDERPALDAFAYDRGQQRVRRAADGPRRSRRPSLAVALCICLGAILSSGGAGLAVSGLSATDQTAVQAQYPTTPTNGYTTTTPTNGYTVTTVETVQTIGTVPTETTEVAGQSDDSGSGSGSGPSVAGETASGGTSPTQAAAQTGATQGSGSLPFTGFAAVPVMLAGLALLMAGLTLRRRRATDL